MKQLDWMETWGRIKKRYPQWQPTEVETEDWCIAFRVYEKEMVEDVVRWVRQQYTSQIPAIKWFIVEIEKRKEAHKQYQIEKNQPSIEDEHAEHDMQKEAVLVRLEETSMDELRTACISVLKRYGKLISRPTSANPREWKPTLRSLVHIELYGNKEK
jgi:hypothetical protein